MNEISALTSGLLAHLGIVDADTRDELDTVVGEVLSELGHDVEIVELRHGVLTLRADSFQANLLAYDAERLLEAVRARLPEVTLERLVVHTRRG
jgi:hypothetical protein